jgi:hypothetical protein
LDFGRRVIIAVAFYLFARFAVTKKLQSEGSGYMIRYDILIGVDRALRTYADSPDVVSELTKFKAWIDELYPVNAWGNR